MYLRSMEVIIAQIFSPASSCWLLISFDMIPIVFYKASFLPGFHTSLTPELYSGSLSSFCGKQKLETTIQVSGFQGYTLLLAWDCFQAFPVDRAKKFIHVMLIKYKTHNNFILKHPVHMQDHREFNDFQLKSVTP